MYNKEITEESKTRQSELFGMLIDIFTPKADIESVETKAGNKWEQTKQGLYTVTSMLSRRECTIKEGRRNIFEIYQDKDYLIATRGKYLKHLVLNESLLQRVRSSLVYHENYDMKHLFTLNKEDTIAICRAFVTRDERYDNGLVKSGEIEGSSRS